MTVYVDDIREYPFEQIKLPARRYGCLWCHMMTDGNLSELHHMARDIGLGRGSFQGDVREEFCHYDLTPRLRDKAIRFGAIEVGTRAYWTSVGTALGLGQPKTGTVPRVLTVGSSDRKDRLRWEDVANTVAAQGRLFPEDLLEIADVVFDHLAPIRTEIKVTGEIPASLRSELQRDYCVHEYPEQTFLQEFGWWLHWANGSIYLSLPFVEGDDYETRMVLLMVLQKIVSGWRVAENTAKVYRLSTAEQFLRQVEQQTGQKRGPGWPAMQKQQIEVGAFLLPRKPTVEEVTREYHHLTRKLDPNDSENTRSLAQIQATRDRLLSQIAQRGE